MKNKKILLIGTGRWGKNWARALNELESLYAICDADSSKLLKIKELYKNTKTFSSFEEVDCLDEVDGVVIATPAQSHYKLAKKSLLAGKHTFVEKPLALSAKEGAELVQLAKTKELHLLVGHVLEYHPAITELKDLIAEGELGRVRYIYSNRLNMGTIRSEENALWSFAPHDIAVILRLLGRMPESVQCRGDAYLNHDLADVTMTNLRFSGRVNAHIFVSWLHPFKEQRLVVVGDKKMAVFDDTAEWDGKLVLYPHKVEWKDGSLPTAHKAEGVKVPLVKNEPLKEECRHFLACIAGDEVPLTDGDSALRVLEILECAQKSLSEEAISQTVSTTAGNAEEVKDYFAHKSSCIEEDVVIGKDTKIWHYSHLRSGCQIGERCVLGQNVFIGSDVRIGNGVKVQNNVSVYDAVCLEDDVFCGPSAVFTNVTTPRSEIDRKHEFKKTLVKKGATLGANCTIVCGNTIGSYAFVGAGAVVSKDIPDYALVVGVPARISGWVCRCGTKLNFNNKEALCKSCGESYQQIDSKTIKPITHENTSV